MKLLSQRDKKWANIQLGKCSNETISSSGCVITCMAIMLDTTPDIINRTVVYVKGCLVSWRATANKLGMEHSYIRNRPIKYPCIAEVKISKGRQHFIVVDGTKQYDPWTGKESKYQILSYRNISPKIKSNEVMISKNKLIKALGRKIGVDYNDDDLGFQGHLKNKNLDTMLQGFFDAQNNQTINVAISILSKELR